MAGSGAEDADAVLSDVEGDDPAPILIGGPSAEEISPEKYREVVAELDRERQARSAAEKSRADIEVSFNRLKALAHEAIKKRDEVARQRDEALREKEDVARQLEEAAKERDGLRSEIGDSTHMLVTGIEKISGKVSGFKTFNSGGGGLPRLQKYSGLAAVAYGVIKRTNEIVEEMLKQVEAAAKSRDEAREAVEQRNYEIAIEVSQLEATISGLREEVSEKDKKVSEVERAMGKFENEAHEMREIVGTWESKLEAQRPLLFDQLGFVSRIHDRVCDVIKIVEGDNSELSESLFLPQETDAEENIRASLAGLESIYELTKIVGEKTRALIEEKNRETKSLDETVSRLNKEKEHIGSLLRSALSKRVSSDSSSKTSDLFQVAENGLREAGIDYKFRKIVGDETVLNSNEKVDGMEAEDEEIFELAGALENIVKTSQLEIIELQHSLEQLRAESSLLKEHIEAQTKEIDHRLRQIEELKEKEKVANDSVEGLMMDIAAAEEEITRWKVAAEQEAAAGRAVEQEVIAQLSALKQELEEAKGAMSESDKKLKFKEETAAAAMAARDAAEKSLRLADSRASRLRERVEELTRQLEEFENREDSTGRTRPRYVCWPWQWLGMDFVGVARPDALQQLQQQQHHGSNEMELSEPFL